MKKLKFMGVLVLLLTLFTFGNANPDHYPDDGGKALIEQSVVVNTAAVNVTDMAQPIVMVYELLPGEVVSGSKKVDYCESYVYAGKNDTLVIFKTSKIIRPNPWLFCEKLDNGYKQTEAIRSYTSFRKAIDGIRML